ncbi:MAG TPA: MBL fold metallo-hydrolase [Candidatus Sulfomarinibacteraceae bacterium]|nr:MBL fold metallo-hydrolase [Candidatus Sulfomarinibacteraceae bacterium]
MKKTINRATLQKMLDEGAPLTVLDVRPAEERAEWAIPGSKHVDIYEALKAGDPDALASVDVPSDRPVVTVCGAGKTSLVAAEQLRARGVRAASLEGGMRAWSLAWNTAEVPVPDSTARVLQVRRTGKGCLSYLIAANGAAAVVDAALEPDVYLELAHEHGWTITDVLDTHVHADHFSRGRLLAEQTGATFHLPAQKRVAVEHRQIRDGDVMTIGGARLEAVHTPGHTPESTSFLLDGQALFTGDTLFLTGVGRPDLEADAGADRERAHLLYGSLQRLLALPDETLVLPGHTSEPVSFDGAPIAETLADVRTSAELLNVSEDDFVETVLARIPPAPPNHERIVLLNEVGRMPDGDPIELEAGANRCAIGNAVGERKKGGL